MSLLLPVAILLVKLSDVRGHSHAPVGYNVLFIIIILELVIAFGIGIVCVIFSINLLRSVSSADSSSRVVMRDRGNVSSFNSAEFYDSDGELDYESTPFKQHK